VQIPTDAAEAARLAYLLFGAGVLLLIMEVFFANKIFLLFGGFCVLGASALAFARVGLEVGSLILLGGTTLISLGFLVVLAYFPNAPISKAFLSRTREIPAEDPTEDDPS
jgi:hypothetical protein